MSVLQILFIFAVLVNSIIAISNQYEIYSNDFIEKMKSAIKSDTDPCDDFIEYSTGVNSVNTARTPQYIQSEKEFFENDPIAKAFMLSCERKQKLNIFQQDILTGISNWPTKKDQVNENTIAKLLAEVAALHHSQQYLFGFLMVESDNMNLHVSRPSYFKAEPYRNIKISMEEHGSSGSGFLTAAREVSDFTANLERIFNENQYETYKEKMSSDQVPGINWNEFLAVFQKHNKNLSAQTKITIADEVTKQFISFISKSDRNVVADYLIFEIIKYLSYDVCDEMPAYFRQAFLKKTWNKFAAAENVPKFKQILSNLEMSYTNFKASHASESSTTKQDWLMEKIQDFQDFFNNSEEIMKPILEISESDYYDNIEIDPDNFYQNYLNIGRRFKRSPMKLNSAVLHLLVKNYNQPLFFNFLNLNMDYWYSIFDDHSDWVKFSNTDNECLVRQGIPDNIWHSHHQAYINNYLIQFARFKKTYSEFVKLLENSKGVLLDNETLMLSKNGINHKKAFFIAQAQHVASKYGETFQHKNYLSNLKEFSEVFNCSAAKPMNFAEKCDVTY